MILQALLQIVQAKSFAAAFQFQVPDQHFKIQKYEVTDNLGATSAIDIELPGLSECLRKMARGDGALGKRSQPSCAMKVDMKAPSWRAVIDRLPKVQLRKRDVKANKKDNLTSLQQSLRNKVGVHTRSQAQMLAMTAAGQLKRRKVIGINDDDIKSVSAGTDTRIKHALQLAQDIEDDVAHIASPTGSSEREERGTNDILKML